MKKRYAIVRVQEKCPSGWNLEPSFCDKKCETCKVAESYGDTKEQMILKVAQILFKNAPKETYLPRYIEQKRKILEVAKKIVEFLGVEE